MDYHNVSCQILMLHSSKDTLRYVKLFGALKSILRGCGVPVPGREAGEGQRHCCPAAQGQPGPSSRLETGDVSPHCVVTMAPWAGTGAGAWQKWPWAAHTAPRTDLSLCGIEWDQSPGPISSLNILISKWDQQQRNNSSRSMSWKQGRS